MREELMKIKTEVYMVNDFIIQREYGISPNGNKFFGRWVLRNMKTGKYIDHDTYRNDLFSRHNFIVNR